jgi:hypothetical protein
VLSLHCLSLCITAVSGPPSSPALSSEGAVRGSSSLGAKRAFELVPAPHSSVAVRHRERRRQARLQGDRGVNGGDPRQRGAGRSCPARPLWPCLRRYGPQSRRAARRATGHGRRTRDTAARRPKAAATAALPARLARADGQLRASVVFDGRTFAPTRRSPARPPARARAKSTTSHHRTVPWPCGERLSWPRERADAPGPGPIAHGSNQAGGLSRRAPGREAVKGRAAPAAAERGSAGSHDAHHGRPVALCANLSRYWTSD